MNQVVVFLSFAFALGMPVIVWAIVALFASPWVLDNTLKTKYGETFENNTPLLMPTYCKSALWVAACYINYVSRNKLGADSSQEVRRLLTKWQKAYALSILIPSIYGGVLLLAGTPFMLLEKL